MPRGLLLVLAVIAAPLAAQSDSLAARILFLDVGQADAVLIRSPEGKTALIDAGGIAEVLRRFPVRYYMDNAMPHTTATYGTLMRTLERSNVTYLEAKERTIALGSVTLRVLPPPRLDARPLSSPAGQG